MEIGVLIDSYQRVLDGEKKYLIRGIWEENAKENFKILLNYLIDDVLMITQDELLKMVDREFFTRYKLRGGLIKIYKENIYAALDDYYEMDIPRWKFKRVPKSFWLDNDVKPILEEMALELKIDNYIDFKDITKSDMDGVGMTKISRLVHHQPYSAGGIAKILYPEDAKKKDKYPNLVIME